MRMILHTLMRIAAVWCFSHSGIAATLFQDNFDAGASSLWGDEQGGWNDVGGVYRSTSGNFAYSSVPMDLGNFSIELDVNDVWDGGIFLRSAYNGGAFNGVSLITGGQGGGGRGVYWHEWTNGVHTPILNHSGIIFASGSDIHVKIDVQGNTYTAFVNGILATTLTSSLYGSGQVALFNNKLRQSFDNVVISTNAAPTPEPSTILLLLLGMAGILLPINRPRQR